jgi:porin-like protein
MGPVKRVLLGSAAGVFAVAGAQAADLPVKAKPVEYVKICSLYGAGFWYVPGTDTCIKVGAYTKLQTEYNATNGPFMMGMANNGVGDNGGRHTRTDTGEFTWNARGVISFDMRQQTEYGTLRSYIDVGEQTVATDNAGFTLGLNAASTLFNSRAFIQFAGFTVGRMRSFFDLYFQGNYAFAAQRFSNDTSPNGIIGYAYTWQFGGGLSASVSLEDGGSGAGGRGRSTINTNLVTLNTVAGSGFSVLNTDNKGQEFFDPVVNLRLDQAWGFVGASAALHDASGGYFQTLEGSGHPGDKFGWAATVGFTLTNVFGLQGDTLAGQGVYSQGAAGYATSGFGPSVFFSGQTLGLGFMEEGVYGTLNGVNTSVQLTNVWSANAAYEHRWNPQWRTSIYGGWIGVNYNGEAEALICQRLAGTISNSGCSPNFSLTEVGSRTLWNPVPDLDVGVDVVWWHLNTAFGGGTANIPTVANSAKPAGAYSIKDQDALSAVFRVQRNFLY